MPANFAAQPIILTKPGRVGPLENGIWRIASTNPARVQQGGPQVEADHGHLMPAQSTETFEVTGPSNAYLAMAGGSALVTLSRYTER